MVASVIGADGVLLMVASVVLVALAYHMRACVRQSIITMSIRQHESRESAPSREDALIACTIRFESAAHQYVSSSAHLTRGASHHSVFTDQH